MYDCDSVGSETRKMQKAFSQEAGLGRDTGCFNGGENSLAERVPVLGRSGTEGKEDRVWIKGDWPAASRWALLPGGPEEERSGLQRSSGLRAGPRHLFPGIHTP